MQQKDKFKMNKKDTFIDVQPMLNNVKIWCKGIATLAGMRGSQDVMGWLLFIDSSRQKFVNNAWSTLTHLQARLPLPKNQTKQ